MMYVLFRSGVAFGWCVFRRLGGIPRLLLACLEIFIALQAGMGSRVYSLPYLVLERLYTWNRFC